MTIAAPIGLSAAIQQSDVKQNASWRRGYWGYSYYRPYVYAYRPYYGYAYGPYYAYDYYRPYAYSFGPGYVPRIWVGWGRPWW
jgi:hypothetical protein